MERTLSLNVGNLAVRKSSPSLKKGPVSSAGPNFFLVLRLDRDRDSFNDVQTGDQHLRDARTNLRIPDKKQRKRIYAFVTLGVDGDLLATYKNVDDRRSIHIGLPVLGVREMVSPPFGITKQIADCFAAHCPPSTA